MFMSILNIIFLLFISSILCTSELLETSEKQKHDLLWCNHCGVSIGETSNLFDKQSPGALKTEYRYVFGKNVSVQTLMNPFHFMFDVITIEKASCADRGRNARGDSWFPGYTWRICTCPSCASQLGWTFEKAISNDVEDTNQNQTFHALILASLHGIYTDSGVALTPRSVRKHESSTAKPLFLKESKDLSLTTASLFHPRANDDQDPAAVTAITKKALEPTIKVLNNTAITKSIPSPKTSTIKYLAVQNTTSPTEEV